MSIKLFKTLRVIFIFKKIKPVGNPDGLDEFIGFYGNET